MANNFPKFHGITLAGNAFIENLHMERLVADPVPVSAGRLWFNTTDKVIKYSGLDAGGAVVIEVIATGASATLLASRVTTLEGLVSALQSTSVFKDGSVAFTGDQSMGGNKLTNVATPVAGSDAANKDFVTSAIAVLGNAFEYVGVVDGGADAAGALDLALQTKKEAGDYYKVNVAGYFKVGAGAAFYANVGDGLIFNTTGTVDKIDNTDSNVAGTVGYITVTGSADTGFNVDVDAAFKARVVAVEGGLAAEIIRAGGVEAGLDTRVGAAEGAITTLQGRVTVVEGGLAQEVTDRQNAIAGEVTRSNQAIATAVSAEALRIDSALSTAISGEVTARDLAIAAEATRIDGALSAAISGEVTARDAAILVETDRAKAAEVAVDTKIGNLSSLTTTNKTSIVNAINDLQILAGGGTDALKSAINAKVFLFTAQAVALTHVITHNLATGYPDVSISVKGDDGVFRNDIVAYDETDANTITVFLTEARIIKASIKDMTAIA